MGFSLAEGTALVASKGSFDPPAIAVASLVVPIAPRTPISEVALPARALGRSVENLVDLSRHDEVILVQSLYFLRLQADRCIAPAKADVRMMAFGLSEFTDLLDKGPCFAKVAEPEGPLDTMSVVAEFPVRGLRTEAFGFLMSEWWDATTAGCACFLGKSFGHVSLSLKTIRP